MRLLAVVALLALAVRADADGKPAPLAPSVQRLAAADEKGAAEALAAVRARGVAVAADLRRAIKRHAGNEARWLRLNRALRLVTEDWQRARTPKGMVYVPYGSLEVPRSERPFGPSGTRINVSAFYIDRTETTVGQWRAWCKVLATREEARRRWRGPTIASEVDDRLPVGGVTQEAAARYAREHRGGRLPTANEFERALRGSGLRTYPWGNAMRAERANLDWGQAVSRPVPVGSYPKGAAPSGALDLVGNLAEWTSTFVPYGRVGRRPLVLGGSYRDAPSSGLTWRALARPRNVQSDRASAAWIGFRVVKSAPALPRQ